MELHWEGQNQDKRASLHYTVLSNHAEMPERGDGSSLPKWDVKIITDSNNEIP